MVRVGGWDGHGHGLLDGFRWVRVFGSGGLCRDRSGYEAPLAARKVRLRVSGAQAIDTIMPISSTAASTIIV